jgi:hypothetical protein
MALAWQTPRGARPNRRGGLARPAESAFLRRNALRFDWRKPRLNREPSGRLLEPHRELRPRGMIVAARCCKAVRRTESGLQAPRHFQQLTNVKHPLRTSRLSGTVPIKLLRQVEQSGGHSESFGPAALSPVRIAGQWSQVVRNDNVRVADHPGSCCRTSRGYKCKVTGCSFRRLRWRITRKSK